MAFSRRSPAFSCSVSIVPFYWIVPSWTQIALGVGIMGLPLLSATGLSVLAFRYADASVLAPFSYVQLVWVTLIGFFLFGEVPDAITFAGAAIIIASGIYTAHRERVRRARSPHRRNLIRAPNDELLIETGRPHCSIFP